MNFCATIELSLQRLRLIRLAEQKQKAENLRLQRKKEEHDRWWAGAEMFGSRQLDTDEDDDNSCQQTEDARSKLAARYALDYSRWNEWTPNDPVSQAEVFYKLNSDER